MSIHIIIADDHTLVREGTRNILRQCNDIVVIGEASDGEEVVWMARERRPDMILMDVAMPGLNGIEATRRVKALYPSIAVLALTAYDDDAYVFALLEAGVAGYLLKTASSDELVAAIRSVYAGESVLSPPVARKVLGRLASPPVDGASNGRSNPLTDRENEVLRLAARGMANKAIARQLELSPRTVQLHLAHIFEKLGVASRTEAVMAGLKNEWLHLRDVA